MTLPIYRHGSPITDLPTLLEYVQGGHWVYFGDKPVSPQWVMQMRILPLTRCIDQGKLFEAVLIKERPRLIRAGQFVA